MDSIESIFAKRQMIEDLRARSLRLSISNEAEHATIFNRIWRLNNEIKSLEAAVNNGVAYEVGSTRYQTQNQTQSQSQNQPQQDDMGDDFTSIPVESSAIYESVCGYAPESLYPNIMQTQNQSSDRQKKLNALRTCLESGSPGRKRDQA